MIAKANIQYTDMSLEQQAAVLQAACSSLLRCPLYTPSLLCCSGDGAEYQAQCCVQPTPPPLHGRLSSELKLHWRVAQATQEAIAEKYPGKWHVLVGKEFGSFVTHEAGRYNHQTATTPVATPMAHASAPTFLFAAVHSLMYVFFKEVGFLIFKHG